MYLKYLYILSLGICSITTIINVLKMPKELRIIALLSIYAFILECSIFFFKQKVSYNGNVLPQYNFFVFVEFMFYAYFFKQVIVNPHVKKLLNLFLWMFPVLWYVFAFICFNILEWNSYSFLLGGTFTIFFALFYCYELITLNDTISLIDEGGFWIAVGLIICYACDFSYMGMFRYLTTNFSQLATNLKKVHLITNSIMYLLFAYAFLCKTTKKFYL